MDLTNFIQDRNEAIASVDKEKILAYCKKYKIKVPEDDEVFWAGVHKAVCNLFLLENSSINSEQFNKSYDWLTERGYTPLIK